MANKRTSGADDVRGILETLEREGLLLVQDAHWPSVVALVAGGPVSGSWWSHPAGKRIFDSLQELDDHADVLFLKLLGGKVTLAHRRLWPAVLAIATAREAWQTDGLSAAARALLVEVDRGPVRASGKAAKELELRLLVHGHQVHTVSGRHEAELEPWSIWAARTGKPAVVTLDAARREVEALVAAGNAAHGASVRLPWSSERLPVGGPRAGKPARRR